MSNQSKNIIGVEWLGQCFDAVELDPLALNQCFKSQGRVFHVQADGPSHETNNGYSVPVGVLLHMTNSTKIQTTSQVIYDTEVAGKMLPVGESTPPRVWLVRNSVTTNCVTACFMAPSSR